MPEFTTHLSLLQRLSGDADPTAWKDFQDRYGLLIRRMARRQGLQDADCDEVVQDVLTSLATALPRFEYDPSKGMFRAYLKTITLRAIYSRRRRDRKELSAGNQFIELAIRDPLLEDIWEQEWRHYHLRQAMTTIEDEFNTQDRLAFEAYALQGDDVQTTADSLGITKQQVYQAKSRILKRLEQLIEAQIQEEG